MIVKPTTRPTTHSRHTLYVPSLFDLASHPPSYCNYLVHPLAQCGLASSPPNFDWKLCDLRLHKHLDTRLQLKIQEEEEGKGNIKKKHWAYAPSLSLSKTAWTPKVVFYLTTTITIFQRPFFFGVCRI